MYIYIYLYTYLLSLLISTYRRMESNECFKFTSRHLGLANFTRPLHCQLYSNPTMDLWFDTSLIRSPIIQSNCPR